MEYLVKHLQQLQPFPIESFDIYRLELAWAGSVVSGWEEVTDFMSSSFFSSFFPSLFFPMPSQESTSRTLGQSTCFFVVVSSLCVECGGVKQNCIGATAGVSNTSAILGRKVVKEGVQLLVWVARVQRGTGQPHRSTRQNITEHGLWDPNSVDNAFHCFTSPFSCGSMCKFELEQPVPSDVWTTHQAMNLLPQLSGTLTPIQAKLRTSFTDTLHFRKIRSMVTKRFAGNFFQSSSCNFRRPGKTSAYSKAPIKIANSRKAAARTTNITHKLSLLKGDSNIRPFMPWTSPQTRPACPPDLPVFRPCWFVVQGV